jgi:hypothetical protein
MSMECFCGCGITLPGRLTAANLRLGEVALEILAWDKLRTSEPLDAERSAELDRLIEAGADCHRRLLAEVHEEAEDPPLEPTSTWLAESRTYRRDRPGMADGGTLLRGPNLKLTDDDLQRLDRTRPERSFSSRSDVASPASGMVGQLERLGGLLEKGLLTEDEFQAAKRRVIEERADRPADRW